MYSFFGKYCDHINKFSKKQKLFFSILLFTCISVLYFVYMLTFNVRRNQVSIFENNVPASIVHEITNDKIIEQTFHSQFSSIRSISLMFGTYIRKNPGKMILEILQDGVVLASSQINLFDIPDNSYYPFKFDQSVKLDKGQQYVLRISAPESSTGNAVALYKTDKTSPNSMLSVNGQQEQGNLVVLIDGTGLISKLYVMKIVLLFFLLFFLLLLLLLNDSVIDNITSACKFSQVGKISSIDYIFFIAISLICFFSFQQGDILHTGASSFAYLNGHFLDFYEYNAQYVGGNNYLPGTYILFAVWNIPIKLLGLVQVPTMQVSTIILMWYKLLPVIFYFLSALVISKICAVIGYDEKKAKIASILFLTTPIGFFSQFIFGQYDIFTVFFMLVGLYFYYKNDLFKFILFLGISFTFKYFTLLIFFPLLLLKQKNYLKIVKNLLIFLIPFILMTSVYIFSEKFKTGVFGFGATSYIFIVGFNTGYTNISLVIFGWLLICAYSFTREISDNTFHLSIYISNLVIFLLFGLSMWHPQWLLFAVPFWILAVADNKHSAFLLVLDVLLMLFFTLFVVNFWTDHVDQNLFKLGIFRRFLPNNLINTSLTMRDIFIFHDKALFFSFFSGLLLIRTLLTNPKYYIGVKNSIVNFNLIRFRFLVGVSIFIIPAFICFFYAIL